MSIITVLISIVLRRPDFRLDHLDRGQVGLGLEVSDFRAAFIAAIVIAVISGLINWLL